MKKFLDNIGKQGSKLQLKEVEVKFVVNDQDVTSKFLLRPLKVVNRYNLIIGLSIYSFNKKFCPVHSISRVRNHVTCDKFDSSHWLKLQHSDWREYFYQFTRIYNRSHGL